MYFGEVINSYKDLIHQRDKFCFSLRNLEALDGEWWDKHASEINGYRFVAVAFSDYDGGGGEIDNLVFQKAKEIADKDGVATYENVMNGGRGYGNPYVMGGNAIIFGEIADKMFSDKDDLYKMYAPLGDLDNDMTELEHTFIEKNIEYISQDKDLAPLSDDDKEFLYNWLNEHGRVLSTDIDYSYDEMKEALNEFRGKEKEDPRQMKLDLGENKGVTEDTEDDTEEKKKADIQLSLADLKALYVICHQAMQGPNPMEAEKYRDRFGDIIKMAWPDEAL